jgi:hypothetical protein
MTITISNNKKDFVNDKYFWRFEMKFRINHKGDIDSYYDEPLQEVEFWLNSRAIDGWERRKNVIYINHPTTMLMFTLNYNEYIRRILENSSWKKSIKETSNLPDDGKPTIMPNIIDVDMHDEEIYIEDINFLSDD